MDRYLVISSDCHTGPPAEVFTDFLDPKYREAYEQAMVGQRKAEPEGTLESKFQGSDRNPHMQETFLSAEPVKDGGQQGAWDPVVRARELDRDGVAATRVTYRSHRRLPQARSVAMVTMWKCLEKKWQQRKCEKQGCDRPEGRNQSESHKGLQSARRE